LKKYSYVTCRGEQTPSKFDTYSRQVKSTFDWEADLNTLNVRQLKSTFGTKRLKVLEMIYIGSEICVTYHRHIQGMLKV